MCYEKLIVDKMIASKKFLISDVFGTQMPLSEDPSEMLEKLVHLPEENKKLIFDNVDSLISMSDSSCCRFMEVAADAGYLKFTPFIIEIAGSSPVLMLKYNRFVYLSKGVKFTVSYTFSGVGEYQSANTSLGAVVANLHDTRETLPVQLLLYMNLLNACAGIDAFTDLLKNHTDVVDEFVRLSAEPIFGDYNVTYDDVCKTVKDVTHEYDTTGAFGVIYRVGKSDTADLCRVCVLSNICVDVESAPDKSYRKLRVELPYWKSSLDYYNDDFSECDVEQELANSRDIRMQLISFALNYMGIVANFVSIHPMSKTFGSIRALNDPSVVTLKDLRAVI